MDTILNQITSNSNANSKLSIYIMGDYNLNIDNYGIDNCVTNFTNLMYTYGLFPLINQPTRITINTQTTIDNIFTSDIENIKASGILTVDITDHLPIFTIIKYQTNKARVGNSVTYKRIIKDEQIMAFRENLSKVNWELILKIHNSNAQDQFTAFHNIILHYFNECFPLKECKVREKKEEPNKPWMGADLISLAKQKNAYFKLFLNSRTQEDYNKYKQLHNNLNALKRKAKSNYYSNKLNACIGDSRETWKTINKFMNRHANENKKVTSFLMNGESITNKETVSEEFNLFFTNIGPKLAERLQNEVDPLKNMPMPNCFSMFLTPVTIQETSSDRQIFFNFTKRVQRQHFQKNQKN
jgi:hypothetical protein